MFAFLIRRLAAGAATLFVIATLCFVITRFTPGSPFSSERALTAEAFAAKNARYGLDRPLPVQYVVMLGNYLRGDLGLSIKYPDRSISELLLPAFRVSICLGLLAILLALAAGVPLGVLAAARQNRLADRVAMLLAVGGICVPNFLLGPLLVMVFAFWFGWVKPAGWPQDLSWEELKKLALPAITLSMVHVAYISRLGRAGMLDVLHKDFVRTARAKGLSEFVVVVKHALRNGITPVVSYLGPMVALILTGSIVVERVFAIPGLGKHFVDAALARDYPMVMGTMLLYSTLLILLNIAVDFAYGILDPRVRVL
ncbi:MAG: ABC transporter permease [Planctomycetes bacterium]|nr:ABC transporter permease [Planctomycetota bacterium]